MNKTNTILHSVARLLGLPIEQVALVGSTLIVGEGNDVDILCFSTSDLKLAEKGFNLDNPASDLDYPSEFTSYRGHGVNLLYTADAEYFIAEVVAAHAAQMVAQSKWDMTSRDYRVLWHNTLRDVATRLRHRPINFEAL